MNFEFVFVICVISVISVQYFNKECFHFFQFVTSQNTEASETEKGACFAMPHPVNVGLVVLL